jgi:hypothetical protein
MLVIRGEEWDPGEANTLGYGLQRRQFLGRVVFGSWNDLLGLRDGRWFGLDSGGCHVGMGWDRA